MTRHLRQSRYCLTGSLALLWNAVACQTDGTTQWFPPTSEPWTIECIVMRGPDRRANSEAIAQVLRTTRGIRANDVRVRHEGAESTVYYSTYQREIDRTTQDRRIPNNLREDLTLIKELVDDRGRRLFIGARMAPQPLAIPNHPEWNLELAQGKYTLQVAAFFNAPEIPNYRQAAYDYCAALRQNGYDAYYYHGESNSVVTVGTFGDEALIQHDGHIGYSDKVRDLQSKEQFTYNLTNGNIWHQVVNGNRAAVRSRLVEIPNPQDPWR